MVIDQLSLPGYGFGGLHKHMAIYAVYDGHGGVRAAKFCEKHLHWNMINEASFSAGNLDRAILNAFQRTDQYESCMLFKR